MPRITHAPDTRSAQDDRASMRPGRNAPDNEEQAERYEQVARGFNEAGAKCPG